MGNILYPPTRPQSVGEVLDTAFRIYGTTLLKCLPYTFTSVILGQTLSIYDVLHRHATTAAAALQAATMPRVPGPIWWILFLVLVVVDAMFANAVFLRQYALATGHPASMRAELGKGLQRAPGVLLVGFLIALAFVVSLIPVALLLAALGASLGVYRAGAGSSQAWLVIGVVLAMLLAASWVLIRWVCSVPIYLLSERGPIASMSHSWELTRGNFWRLSVIYTVGVVLLLVFYFLASIVGGMAALWLGRGDVLVVMAVTAAVIALLAALFTPFYHALVLAVFGDLSARREGADLAQRISAPATQ
jgi:Membrane domain of glycerophosphoryl diester phosphodiesterase